MGEQQRLRGANCRPGWETSGVGGLRFSWLPGERPGAGRGWKGSTRTPCCPLCRLVNDRLTPHPSTRGQFSSASWGFAGLPDGMQDPR